MRSYLPSFVLKRARALDEALLFMAQPPGMWRPFAGGTDLMVQLAAGSLRHQHYVSIWGIDSLRGVETTPECVYIGSLTTYADIQRDATLRDEFPLLCQAASETGGIATQNRGTIGGNIANASPAADTPPALLVYDAELELVSARGRRHLPYHRFHTGYKQMALAPDELIAGLRLPRRRGWVQQYRKVGGRQAQAISKVCFAGAAAVQDGRVSDVRLAFASVAPTVLRARATEDRIKGRELSPAILETAAETLATELVPIDDFRSTAKYRLRVAQNLLRDFLVACSPE